MLAILPAERFSPMKPRKNLPDPVGGFILLGGRRKHLADRICLVGGKVLGTLYLVP